MSSEKTKRPLICRVKGLYGMTDQTQKAVREELEAAYSRALKTGVMVVGQGVEVLDPVTHWEHRAVRREQTMAPIIKCNLCGGELRMIADQTSIDLKDSLERLIVENKQQTKDVLYLHAQLRAVREWMAYWSRYSPEFTTAISDLSNSMLDAAIAKEEECAQAKAANKLSPGEQDK